MNSEGLCVALLADELAELGRSVPASGPQSGFESADGADGAPAIRRSPVLTFEL